MNYSAGPVRGETGAKVPVPWRATPQGGAVRRKKAF